MKNESLLFAITSSTKLAKKISEESSIPLGEVELNYFADGEFMARVLSNVKDKVTYIVQSTCKPSPEKIFEILVLSDALKQCGAKEIILIIPYFGFARQDRVAREGEPITAKLVANMFEVPGISKVISVDLHTFQIQGFFSCPVENLQPTLLFADYYHSYFEKEGISYSDLAVVSPDHGSALRARDLCSEFEGAELVFIDKRRPAPNKSEVTNVVGNIKDKYCLIIDDIIDTGGTIDNAVDALLNKGAKGVYVCATHGVFSRGKIDPRIKKIVVTDTIENNFEGVTVLSVAKLIADAIK